MATSQNPGTNRLQVLTESVCRSLDLNESPDTEDFRQLMNLMQQGITAALPGGVWPVAGGAKASGQQYPTGIGFTVSGANGVFTASMTGSSGTQGQTVWFQIQYSTVSSFTTNVTVMPTTSATSVTISSPGQTLFFRMRASFDQTNWSPWQMASTAAVSSGLVSSSATSNAGAFNQTNYGIVTSVAVGSSADVQVQGANGAYTSMVAQKGPVQSALPSATVAGVTPGSDLFVGYDGRNYVLRSTLADVLADDGVTPIGKVSVVGTGTPTLPTIVPIISSGSIIGYNVTNGGSGASAPYILTIAGAGSGATTGAQTIVAGVLISVAPGNPGSGYGGGTTVTASGGVFPGTAGGGTAVGGNGGRLTAV
jgi:hypothetical protein